MITIARGNLLDADAEALVNTVNCVGVMGKGVALQFKQAYPENFRAYEQACRKGQVKLGEIFTFRNDKLVGPRYIINFPTKNHWRGRSKLEDIESGLAALVKEIQHVGIRSIAVPPLGCGNGGLDWSDVRPRIEAALGDVPELHVLLYEPRSAPRAEAMPVTTKAPNMTRSRAMILALLDRYAVPGYRLSMIEVQKLAYFLQVAGEPLNLKYVKHIYGPYAETLQFVMQRLEGHFIRGYGDRSRHPMITVLPDARLAAETFLHESAEARPRLERIGRLIEGFESPYGLELLSSVHWVVQEDPAAAADVDRAIVGVHAWSARKQAQFRPEHIKVAWRRLRDEGWLTPVHQEG